MSVEIKYKEPEDRPIERVEANGRRKPNKAWICVGEGYIQVGSQDGRDTNAIYLTLDDAEAFFKAGLKLVEQQRRAQ